MTSAIDSGAEAMAVDVAAPSPAQNGSRSSSSHFRLQLVADLVGHDGRCWGVDWSPEGDTLASCGADRTVRTWHQLRSRSGGAGRTGGGGGGGEGEGEGEGGRWGPDAVLEESQARAVRAVAWAPPPAAVTAAAASSKQRQQPQRRRGRRRRLAAASFDASVAVWEEERPAAAPPAGEGGEIENDDDDDDDEPTLWSQVALLQGHESEVKGVAWSPLPGAIEAGSCSEEEEEEDENEEEKKDEKSSSPSKPLPPLLADGEGCLLATCGRDRSVWLWESVPDSAAPPSSSPFDGSGTGGAGSASCCEFECVDVKQGHSGDVKAVAWHPSGSVLASASYDGSVRLWVPEGGAAEEGPGGGGGVGGGNAAAAAAAGDEWLCGQEVKGAHGGETVWSFAFEPRRGGARRRRKEGRSKANAVRAASCGGDGRVSVWRCPLPFRGGAKGEPAATEALRWEAGAVARSAAPPPLGGRVRPAYSVDWSPCGRWIACGGGDDFVRVFRAPPREEDDEGEEVGGGEEKKSAAAAAAATSGGETAAVLELVAEARPSPPCEVNCVKWRRGRKKTDPPVLAAACDDGVVRLWRLVGEGGGE